MRRNTTVCLIMMMALRIAYGVGIFLKGTRTAEGPDPWSATRDNDRAVSTSSLLLECTLIIAHFNIYNSS